VLSSTLPLPQLPAAEQPRSDADRAWCRCRCDVWAQWEAVSGTSHPCCYLPPSAAAPVLATGWEKEKNLIFRAA